MNPYRTLKVKNTATKDEIVAAFRKRALETHPDRGGSAEKFQQVKEAYRVLSNEALREEYDATGTMPAEPKKQCEGQEQNDIEQCIFQAFLQVFKEMQLTGRSAKTTNLTHRMTAVLTSFKATLTLEKTGLTEAKEFLTEARARFSDPAGFLPKSMKEQLEGVEKGLQSVEQRLNITNKAIDQLGKVGYTTDKEASGPRWDLPEPRKIKSFSELLYGPNPYTDKSS